MLGRIALGSVPLALVLFMVCGVPSCTINVSDGGDAGTGNGIESGSGGGGGDASSGGGSSSGSGGSASDGGSNSGSSSGSGSGSSSGIVTNDDGTTGKPCSSSSECKGASPNALGTNVCSNTITFTATNVTFQPFPTPICQVPASTNPNAGNCDPCGGTVPCDGNVHFCDGPDSPSSPGICVPDSTSNPMPGQGTCLPSCKMSPDGSPSTGCTGHNRCVPFTWILARPRDSGPGTVTGYGFCQGTCESDSDCSALGAGWVCQTDLGFCTKAKVARTKAIGTACVSGAGPTSDLVTGACFCIGGVTGVGYCTSVCVVGGTPCPNGYLCDAFEPRGPLTFGSAGTYPALTTQNVGVVGTCQAACSVSDAGAGPDGGSSCPPNSTCQVGSFSIAGPDCIP
jgi:hypothetical protein